MSSPKKPIQSDIELEETQGEHTILCAHFATAGEELQAGYHHPRMALELKRWLEENRAT